MSFPPSITERVLLDCRRSCCICRKFCGFKIELHHIFSKEDGGGDTYENCIPLCFDCHAEVRAYDPKHPKGHKYTASELRTHRNRWYEMVRKCLGVTSNVLDGTITFLSNRKEYNDAVIEAIDSGPRVFRAIILGPHFFHPHWVMERRKRREPRKSFSRALHTYLIESLHEHDRDIRLILRNSTLYPERLRLLVEPHEVDSLIQEMLRNLREMFHTKQVPNISFCCMDPGHYHGVVITEKSCLVSIRETNQSRIERGYEMKNPDNVKIELSCFDMSFDANFRGLNEEMTILEKYIISLRQLIYPLSST